MQLMNTYRVRVQMRRTRDGVCLNTVSKALKSASKRAQNGSIREVEMRNLAGKRGFETKHPRTPVSDANCLETTGGELEMLRGGVEERGEMGRAIMATVRKIRKRDRRLRKTRRWRAELLDRFRTHRSN